ncbi:hypothetical protein DFP72DRAFT_856341 [Ephemerocybe angulata]|uniref:Uncharacterized protein n=1 Tax=Ephemerocybe angulata TaxID=980116 RepID=A0A8H6HEG5_9AGAR|nr:hypothetical protein DFP72DRAFT_856341 [Tulosesus angulatus]
MPSHRRIPLARKHRIRVNASPVSADSAPSESSGSISSTPTSGTPTSFEQSFTSSTSFETSIDSSRYTTAYSLIGGRRGYAARARPDTEMTTPTIRMTTPTPSVLMGEYHDEFSDVRSCASLSGTVRMTTPTPTIRMATPTPSILMGEHHDEFSDVRSWASMETIRPQQHINHVVAQHESNRTYRVLKVGLVDIFRSSCLRLAEGRAVPGIAQTFQEVFWEVIGKVDIGIAISVVVVRGVEVFPDETRVVHTDCDGESLGKFVVLDVDGTDSFQE